MAEIVSIPQPIFRGRISLKVLRGLPKDTFLVSNVISWDRQPAIMVCLSADSVEDVFSWIKEADLEGRLFYGFRSRVDYLRWKNRGRWDMASSASRHV